MQVTCGPKLEFLVLDYEKPQAAEKIVYSRTLEAVSSARTRVEREFDPEAIRRLKESSGADITIGGPEHCRTTSLCG